MQNVLLPVGHTKNSVWPAVTSLPWPKDGTARVAFCPQAKEST